MKKLVKTTVMFLLFLGIVLTTNAQKTKTYTYYTFAIAISYNKKAEKGDRYHVYFSKIISRTCRNCEYGIYSAVIGNYFSEEKYEFQYIWLDECKIKYGKKGEDWDNAPMMVDPLSEDPAKHAVSWSSTKRGAYKARQRSILEYKNNDYKVHY